MKTLPKILVFLFFLFSFLIFNPRPILAQNKAGINIGDHFGDFDAAAGIVGAGGWVVIMPCPGDADKIAQMIENHPEINLVIRGHYPGTAPDENWAKQWAAALASIPSSNKIYFMPWNEPNQTGSNDYIDESTLKKYIQTLSSQFSTNGILDTKVLLLSPMINPSNPSFDNYVANLGSSFFNQFYGIALSLYDFGEEDCGAPLCGEKHRNPQKAQELLSQMGVPGKPIFGVESGTGGNNFYFKQPPSSDSPLYRYVNEFIKNGNVTMFAVPAYDLAGEVGHTWDLFSPEDVINLLKSAPDGKTTPSSYSQSGPKGSLTLCPGKKYSYYVTDESECNECGSAVSFCKPIKEVTTFGEELSKDSLNLPESATYRKSDGDCLSFDFQGKIEVSNFSIPFAKTLNKYFLGSLVDNPKQKITQTPGQVIKTSGVLEKLAPVELQNQLKLEFLNEIANPNYKGRYLSFTIEGKGPAEIVSIFSTITEKNKNGKILTQAELDFKEKVWPQVPLFANEESKGHISFYGSGIQDAENTINTSVPEIYRLYRTTELIKKMLVPDSVPATQAGIVRGVKNSLGQVLPATVCPVTNSVPVQTSNKETRSGFGDKICVKPEIQDPGKQDIQLSGTREWENDAGKSCKTYSSDEIRRYYGISDPSNKCCGDGGNYVFDRMTGSGAYAVAYYRCLECHPGATCWYEENGNKIRSETNCCVPESPVKTKDFTDTNINSINKVPFLDKIIENTVGGQGFFNIFVPSSQKNKQPDSEINQAFREVAGESQADLKIEVNQITKTPASIQEVKVAGSSTGGTITGSLRLLFYKLGTLINVKEFITQKLLAPYSESSTGTPNPGSPTTTPGQPGVLTYNLPFRDPTISVSAANKDCVSKYVLKNWPTSQIAQKWEVVQTQAKRHDWNPAFLTALWVEESGANAVGDWGLGCTAGEFEIESQLDCVFRNYDSETNFERFMCNYSEGHYPCNSFTLNPDFPKNLKYWYDQLAVNCTL
ncbi:MAG: hypothetical protein BWY24_00281 [Microgenomates group bacterium ADurb.Bin219]|nr:MAG: hypothetical protein BWY24_00281 [Microgenomates group bacterium ADurb.Bin219]HNP89407.1 hypothetical protein [Candidatus Woesebacteria bacterium]